MNPKIIGAIVQSLVYALSTVDKDLVNAADGVRVDITFHTPHGWQPSIEGENVELPNA
jgi:hypothetical protein